LTLEWELTVREGTDVEIYAISLNGKRQFAPDEICGRMFVPCRIAFQLEPNMLIYWVEKHRRSPPDEFPEQPDGFPIAPAA
jgi:hypothetical protein